MALTRIRAQQISDIDYKQAVRVITVTNVTLSGGAPSTVDGVNLVAGDRILVAGQSTGSQNGLYDVSVLGTGSDGTWVRTADGDVTGEIQAGMIVMVTEGTAYRDTQWKLTTNNPIVIGTTALAFEQNTGYAFGNLYANGTAVLSNAASGTVTLTAGDNIAITGNNTSKTVTIGVTGLSLNSISNGTSNVNVVSSGGDVTVGVGGVSNVGVFSPTGLAITGDLSVSGNATLSGNILGDRIVNGTTSIEIQTASGNANISVSGASNVTVFTTAGQEVAGAVSATGNVTGGNILTGGLISATGNVTTGNVLTGGQISAAGNITGNYFFGNGSQLSGIITSVANINNGTSNVDIASANANVTVSVAGTSNVAVFSTGGLSVSGNITGNGIPTTTVSNTAPSNPEQGDIWINSDSGIQYIYFTSGGNSQWAEMEAAQSFSSGGTYGNANVVANLAALGSNPISTTGNITAGYFIGNGSQLTGLPASYGNTEVLAYLTTGVAGNILPSANVTYNLGSTANRWNDIWLANSTIYLGEANISSSGTTLDLPSNVALGAVSMSTSTGSLALPVGTTVGGSLVETPKIANLQITNSSWTVLDDTAISLDGGYFIVNGSGFQSGATVIVNNTAASAVTFVSSTVLRCQVGAASAGSYIVYVSNPDGGTALKPAGLTYSATPTWVTGSTLADAQSGQAYTANLSASGATSYALAAGNSLPTGMSLAGNGQISGTTTVESNTTYNFTINAIDAELQDSPRAFSLTVSVEPALGSFYNGGYYAGRIAIDGNLYRIIVAPKATGQDYRQIASSGNAPSVTTEQTRYDGWTTTNAMINAGGWPAASWARGLTINGYNDWYLPSTWEMCLCFATFKPTTTNNDTSMGSNAYTRTPGWPANTAFQSQTPARTTDALFQLPSGAQAFNKGYATNSNLYYITYSANSGGSAYTVSFDSDDGAAGRGLTNNGYWSVSKTEYLLVRVIRRELIGPA